MIILFGYSVDVNIVLGVLIGLVALGIFAYYRFVPKEQQVHGIFADHIMDDIGTFIDAVMMLTDVIVDFGYAYVIEKKISITDYATEVNAMTDHVVEKLFTYMMNRPEQYANVIRILQFLGKDRIIRSIQPIILLILKNYEPTIREALGKGVNAEDFHKLLLGLDKIKDQVDSI